MRLPYGHQTIDQSDVRAVVDVLRGADTDAIRQRQHNELSTYGIGGDLNRPAWQAIGRELLRLGFLEAGKFSTLTLTATGREVLRQRTSITLTKPVDVATKRAKGTAGAIECDEVLFERLRGVRRKLADERNVPAYVIFSDVSLREMARCYPVTPNEFGQIPGVGEQKLRDLSEPFLVEIKDYLTEKSRPRLNDSQLETHRRFQSGESIEQIARARGFVTGTIYSHLAAAVDSGQLTDRARFFTTAQEKEIAAAFKQVITGQLVDVAAFLGNKYDIGLLRIFRAFVARK